MGRRLILLAGTVLAVSWGVGLVLAQTAADPRQGQAQPEPPPPDPGPPPTLPPPEDPPPSPPRDPAAQAKSPSTGSATAKSPAQPRKPPDSTGSPADAPQPIQSPVEHPPGAAGTAGRPGEREPSEPAPGALPEILEPIPGQPAAPGSPSTATTPLATGPLPSPSLPGDDPLPPRTEGLPPSSRSEALRDDQAIRVQAPAVQASAPAGSGGDGPFVLPVDRLPLGRQSLGLTVDVQAPAVVNLNQETRLKIVVRNTSSTEAMGVVVRDVLPDGLKFLDSQPPAQPAGQILTWKLGTIPASTERVLTVRVLPVQVGSHDHSATVVMMAGSKSRTLVQQPKLKVEQTVKQSKVLKGGQVEFNIAVSNPGTGAARNVLIQAKLSSGLRHEEGDHIQQRIDLIKPGERKELDPVVVDALAGGEQSCTVSATSRDVTQESDEARSVQTMLVVEPRLELKLTGPSKRYTDTVAVYKIQVQNPGSAVARDIRIVATLPVGGTLISNQADSPYFVLYDRYKRRIYWTVPQLEPNSPVVIPFSVRLGGMQLFQVTARATAAGPLALAATDTFSTDVTGMADVQFQILEPRRVVDVGEMTEFEIRIKNQGSKEATQLLIAATLSEHIRLVRTGGTDEVAKGSPDGHEVVFPAIDRLPPSGELVLKLWVQGEKEGIASCHVSLMHDDLGRSTKIERTAITRITAAADTATR